MSVNFVCWCLGSLIVWGVWASTAARCLQRHCTDHEHGMESELQTSGGYVQALSPDPKSRYM